MNVPYKYIYNMTLKGTTIPGLNGNESNRNKGVVHTPQMSRWGTSPSDAVLCHTLDTPFYKEVIASSAGYTVGVF